MHSQCRKWIPHFRSVKWWILELKWGIEKKNVLLKVSNMYCKNTFGSVQPVRNVYCLTTNLSIMKEPVQYSCKILLYLAVSYFIHTYIHFFLSQIPTYAKRVDYIHSIGDFGKNINQEYLGPIMVCLFLWCCSTVLAERVWYFVLLYYSYK